MKRDRNDPNQPLLFGDSPSPVELQSAKPIDRSKVYACVESAPPLPGERRHVASLQQQWREGKRIIARLPVPRPLPEAITAGHFGYGEDGKPIRPSAEEVREITDTHAYKLIGLLQSMNDELALATTPRDQLMREFNRAIESYAEDFGSHSAKQLEAYVRREAKITVASNWSR